jgi:metal-responsive CopG/Arc/MetJ family transcriptional regulator
MEMLMAVRFKLFLSDELSQAIDKVSEETETSKSEILRKALQLYLVAYEGKEADKKVGLVFANETLETEFIGL